MSLLAGLLSAVESVVGVAGGLGLAAAMAVESVFPPIPSEVVLPLAASLVASGALSFLVAVLAATAGSVLGAWVLYAMGRFGGRPALLRLGPLRRIDEARLARAEAWFARRGDWLVVVGRLVPGLRAVVSIPAGTADAALAVHAADRNRLADLVLERTTPRSRCRRSAGEATLSAEGAGRATRPRPSRLRTC